jgi:hypothetical protein
MEDVNAVSKNKYSSHLPGYLSIKSDFTKLTRMIPCPMKDLRDSVKNIVCTWHSQDMYHLKMMNILTMFVPENKCMLLLPNNIVNIKLARTSVSLYAHILKNGYSILGQLFTLRHANTYCLTPLVVAEKLKRQTVNM